MSSDGVEMAGLDADVAQIYMERGGGRYSLLSAVDVDGTVPVGLYVPGAGTAVIGLGGDCRADDYDTVVLTDALTGRTVDLKEEDYGFYASEAGDVNGRFSIQFNKRLDIRGGAWAYADDNQPHRSRRDRDCLRAGERHVSHPGGVGRTRADSDKDTSAMTI